jgi:oligoendopeptidase F
MSRRFFSLLVCAAVLTSAAAASAADLPPYRPDANATRAQVPDAYKWNLTQLFADDAAWKAEIKVVRVGLPALKAYAGTLRKPSAMVNCLKLYFDMHDRTSRIAQYANLALDSEQTNQERQARKQLSLSLLDELNAASGFLRGELLALDDATMKKAYAAADGPSAYRNYIENLRRRKSRVLSPETEKVLQLAGDNLWLEIDLNEVPSPYEEAFGALLSDIAWPKVRDAGGKEVQLTLSNYPVFRASSDRRVREEAVTAFYGTLRRFQQTFAATLAGQFELDVTFARARSYDTALEAYLDKDNVPVAVHDNLIGAVNANLKPLHRYVELRRQVLGLDEIRLYDLNVPLTAEAEMDVPYAKAREILPAALAPLGSQYVEMLNHGLDPRNGWIDVYPSNDKDSGAFSASVYGRHPYVKMNYQDTLDDLSTLAHEYGHALHSHLAMTHQPYHDHRYVMFLAEIASTCNEALLSDYLVKKAESQAARIGILAAELETIRSTIYRQTLFSEFERAVHGFVEQGIPVTAALLDETYAGLVKRYYGPGFTVGPNDGMEWAYIPHFYYKYYVYSYATGLSCGIAIAENVKAKGQPAVDGYLQMLSGGCAEPPLDLLKKAGVDLTRPDAINAALARFDRIVTELAGLLNVKLQG